jgi:hypothetical protein
MPQHNLRPIIVDNTDKDQRSPVSRNKAVVSFVSELAENRFRTKPTTGTRRNTVAAIPRMTRAMEQDAVSSLEFFEVDALSGSPSRVPERAAAPVSAYSWTDYPSPSNSPIPSQPPSRAFSISEGPVMLAQEKNQTVTSVTMSSANRVRGERRRKASSTGSTFRGKEPEQPRVMATSIVPPFVPDAPQRRQGPPPTPRPQRLSTPDIPDIYQERQAFWQCHDPHRASSVSRKMIEERTLPPLSPKMQSQCKITSEAAYPNLTLIDEAAIAHMGGRLPSARQSQDFYFGDESTSAVAEVNPEVKRLIAMGYSLGTAIAIIQAKKEENEEVGSLHPNIIADANLEGQAARSSSRDYHRRY